MAKIWKVLLYLPLIFECNGFKWLTDVSKEHSLKKCQHSKDCKADEECWSYDSVMPGHCIVSKTRRCSESKPCPKKAEWSHTDGAMIDLAHGYIEWTCKIARGENENTCAKREVFRG